MILPPLPGRHELFVPVVQLPLHGPGPVRVGLVPPELAAHPLILPPEFGPVARPLDMPRPALVLSLWLGGALLWFAWQMLRYHIFVHRAVASGIRLGREAGVDVIVSEHVGGPVAAGILRRRIFLPADFLTRYSSAERRQALLHEGAHHDRHDLVANVAGLAMLALHWWNPLAHRAHRAFRADQEQACDATVLADADAQARYAYGSALVKSSCVRTPAAACALDRATEIKSRLMMIKRGRIAFGRHLAGGLVVLCAIGGGLMVTASGSHASVGIEHSIAAAPPADPIEPAAMPAPVAPPAPPVDAVYGSRRASLDDSEARRVEARARAAGDAARQEALASVDVARLTQQSLAEARASMVARCAARGRPVRADEHDWGSLALCGRAAFDADIRHSIDEARADAHRERRRGESEVAQAEVAVARAQAEAGRR